MTNQSLIYIPKPKPNARLRLLCFPYAGGNSITYLSWQPLLNPDVELAVIQLPGRGIRITETPYTTMAEMVKDLFLAIESLDKKTYIFYGHSMGARVAYELILMLRRFHYRLPDLLIASGSIAPCIERTKEKIHTLPDKEFIEKIGNMKGSNDDVLANQEIMELLLPALRADFKIIENYCNKNKLITPTRISVLAGTDDDADQADLEPWLSLFNNKTGIHWIPGDHFFVDKNKKEVIKVVNNLIAEYCDFC